MTAPRSYGGRQLWGLLPEHYRARDNGDLAAYVDALGGVLDLVRGVIQQRVADSFPDHPDLQPWVLPYLAGLIDTRLVSPDEAGRRAELVNATTWRKTKGTLRIVEQIAGVLGGFGTSDAADARGQVEVQEGWTRVAVTPRVPLAGAASMGTVDLRFYSRRVATDATRKTIVQANPHGVPVFPGSAEDAAARTPDLRTPTWRAGHAHPRRALIFTVPHAGYFPPGWEAGPPATGDAHGRSGGVLVGTQEIDAGDGVFTLTDCLLDGTLHVKSGTLALVRCAVRALVVDTVATASGRPVVTAADCLFQSVASAGLAQLTFCTVLGAFAAPRVWTSDSLFAGAFAVPKPAEPWHKTTAGTYDGTPESAIRYSRVPPTALAPDLVAGAPGQPAQRRDFLAFRSVADRPVFSSTAFAAPGSGVLLPTSGPAIDAGAEDGGELGAYHHRRHAIRARAVIDKLNDYLPVGQVAIVIPDGKLDYLPPILKRP